MEYYPSRGVTRRDGPVADVDAGGEGRYHSWLALPPDVEGDEDEMTMEALQATIYMMRGAGS